MFTVYDNGRKAQYPDCKVHPWWDNASFDTLEKARAYAKLWLGQWDYLPTNWDGDLFDYSGSGDHIEIRNDNGTD